MYKFNKLFKIVVEGSDTLNESNPEYMKVRDVLLEELDIEINFKEIKKGNVSILDDSIFIRDDGRKADRICSIINKYFNSHVIDVTNDVISNNGYIKNKPVVIDDEIISDYHKNKFEKIDNYSISNIKIFREDNTSIDDVLDKIVDKGMDYLDDIDKEVLKNKKPS